MLVQSQSRLQCIFLVLLNFQELVDALNPVQAKALILKMVEAEPGLVFDLLQGSNSGPSEPGPSGPSGPGPKWCKCVRCREMTRDIDKVCCECLPHNCISQRPVNSSLSPYLDCTSFSPDNFFESSKELLHITVQIRKPWE